MTVYKLAMVFPASFLSKLKKLKMLIYFRICMNKDR